MNLQDRALLPEEMRHTYSVCPVCLKRPGSGRAGQADISGKNLPGSRDIFQCNLEK